MADFVLARFGSRIGFIPMTPAAENWIDANMKTKALQWLGAAFWIEEQHLAEMIGALARDGLTVTLEEQPQR